MCVPMGVCVYALCVCVFVSGNQSFDRQISAHEKGGGVRRVRQWIWTGNCLQCTSLLHDINWGHLGSTRPCILWTPINVMYPIRVCVCVRMRACVPAGVNACGCWFVTQLTTAHN